MPRVERPFFVLEALELALFEGLWPRIVRIAAGEVSHRWHLESGVALNHAHPETFWIPSQAEKQAIGPGSIVLLAFVTEDDWGERMWVEVDAVGDSRVVGRLLNQPVGIARLDPGRIIEFDLDHVIDIADPDDETEAHAGAEDVSAEPVVVLCRCCSRSKGQRDR